MPSHKNKYRCFFFADIISATFSSFFSHMMIQTKSLALNSLNADIWALIFDELYSTFADNWNERWSGWSESTPLTVLSPLSMTCKQLRHSVLPWLFRDIRYSFRKSLGFIPHYLWKYIQILRLNDRWSSDCSPWWHNEFQEIVQQFPHLRTVHLKLVGVNPALFHWLSSSHSLTTIVLDAHPYLTDTDIPSSLSFPALRRFVHVKSFRSYPSITPDCRMFLSHFVQSSLSSFTHLDIPIAALPATTDTPNGMVLSSLESLKLRGRFSQSKPIWTFLQLCPALRELEIDVIPDSPIHPHIFTIFPMNATATLSDCQISQSLRSLQRLTITHPDPLDRIFPNLPARLEYLSIPGVRFQNKGCDILPNKDLLIHVLSRCSSRHLKELQFSVQEDLSPELFSVIQSRFPELRVLEVRQRSCLSFTVSNEELNKSELDVTLEAVGKFQNLTELRLNLQMEWNSPAMSYSHIVKVLASRSKSLESVWFRIPRQKRDMHRPWHKEYVIEPRNSEVDCQDKTCAWFDGGAANVRNY